MDDNEYDIDGNDNHEKSYKGDCMGVGLDRRGDKDNHIMLTLMIGDDGNWHDRDFQVDSYWIDELIEKLEDAKSYMERKCINDGDSGWKFKK